MEILHLLERFDVNGSSTHDYELLFTSVNSAHRLLEIQQGKSMYQISESVILHNTFFETIVKKRWFSIPDSMISKNQFQQLEKIHENDPIALYDYKSKALKGISIEQIKYFKEYFHELRFLYLLDDLIQEKTDEMFFQEQELEMLTEELRETQNTLSEIRDELKSIKRK